MSQPEEESQPTTKPTGFPPYVEKLLTGKELSRYWFPVGKAITKEYVKAVCGVQTYNWTDREYGVIMKKMARDKKEIYSYSKGQIESTILANIRKDGHSPSCGRCSVPTVLPTSPQSCGLHVTVASMRSVRSSKWRSST